MTVPRPVASEFVAAGDVMLRHNGRGEGVATSKPAKLDDVRTGNVAEVDIAYTTTTYSINYKDSRGLDYDGSNIHSNYNGWVQKLDRAIARQLATL